MNIYLETFFEHFPFDLQPLLVRPKCACSIGDGLEFCPQEGVKKLEGRDHVSDILVDLVNKVITLRKQFPQVIVLETGIVRRSLYKRKSVVL